MHLILEVEPQPTPDSKPLLTGGPTDHLIGLASLTLAHQITTYPLSPRKISSTLYNNDLVEDQILPAGAGCRGNKTL